MANEYLQRTPTSTGNRRVWTWSGWVKLNSLSTSFTSIMEAFTGSNDVYCLIAISSNTIQVTQDNGSGGVLQITASPLHRDPSSWFNLLVSVDTTQTLAQNRVRIYVNGDEEVVTYTATPSINFETHFNRTGGHRIGTRWNLSGYINAEYTDVFLVDGQALTPDVFGFYKIGKGYISAGSTQATDFRPGQWVPKTPRVIKTAINNNGGFGVNGFYLPMNDSRNFGADFHCDPNSIITLNEKLPQPRVGVASTASVGIGYTDALRADPYAANLVLALPFVSGGLSSGFGDYAPSIKGSGTAKTIVSTSATIANVSAASTSGLYYGSGASFSNSGIGISFASSSDFAFGTGDYTVECWIHRSNASSSSGSNALWSIGTVNTVGALSLFYEDNSFMLRSQGTGDAIYTNDFLLTSSNFSTQQWNHFAVCRKGATVTLYVNGVAAGISTTSSRNVNTNPFIVGSINLSGLYPFFGFMQDLRVYKGVAKYTGGFDVPRPYTPVGIATWRAVPDTTANNFATLNPLSNGNAANGGGVQISYTNGNNTATWSAGNNNATFGTVGINTGRWYWEGRLSTVGASFPFIGISSQVGINSCVAIANNGIAAGNNGVWLGNGGISAGDIVGVAVSFTSAGVGSTITFFINNTAVTNLNYIGNRSLFDGQTNTWIPSVSGVNGSVWDFNFGQNPTFSGNTTAGTYADTNGKGLFKYQPPSGFLALCEDNLPTPAIANPGRHFKTVLYTGNGNSGRSIVGVGFTPDLVWIKARDTLTGNNILVDSVRGSMKTLFSEQTLAEYTDRGVYSFNADGFTTGSANGDYSYSGANYVAWCWRAGAGTTSTNTNGSITSVVSANQDAGFSIVSYTGTGASNATVGHGLGKTPGFAILKCRDTNTTNDNWWVQHKSLINNYYLFLTTVSAQAGPISGTSYGGLGSFSSSTTFTLTSGTSNSNNVNESGKRFIAYCWAEIEGYSKFGSYNGNGSTDGPFIWTGFSPAWVMIKRTAGAADWVIHDSSRTSTNPSDTILRPNTSDIDLTASSLNIDFLSNGFKIRNTNGSYNNAELYIFAAFASSPFTTANSK